MGAQLKQTFQRVMCVFHWNTMDLIGSDRIRNFKERVVGCLAETSPPFTTPISVFRSLCPAPAGRSQISAVLTEAAFVRSWTLLQSLPSSEQNTWWKHLLLWESRIRMSLFQMDRKRRGATCFPLKRPLRLKQYTLTWEWTEVSLTWSLKPFVFVVGENRKTPLAILLILQTLTNIFHNQCKHHYYYYNYINNALPLWWQILHITCFLQLWSL